MINGSVQAITQRICDNLSLAELLSLDLCIALGSDPAKLPQYEKIEPLLTDELGVHQDVGAVISTLAEERLAKAKN